jgi:hypothetical protein
MAREWPHRAPASQVVLKKVTSFERHETHTEYHYSVAVKLFFALFMNTGLTALVVNAKLKDTRVPTEVGVFSGEFTSFSPRWFSGAVAGAAASPGACLPRRAHAHTGARVSLGQWWARRLSSPWASTSCRRTSSSSSTRS